MDYPDDRVYSNDHEWAYGDEDIITVGITDFAQHSLGDIVFVELPSVGDEVVAGDGFGEVESVKSVSELLSPVTGEVIEVNELLEEAPEILNSDPHGSGWLIKVRSEDPHSLEGYMDADAYNTFIGE